MKKAVECLSCGNLRVPAGSVVLTKKDAKLIAKRLHGIRAYWGASQETDRLLRALGEKPTRSVAQ